MVQLGQWLIPPWCLPYLHTIAGLKFLHRNQIAAEQNARDCYGYKAPEHGQWTVSWRGGRQCDQRWRHVHAEHAGCQTANTPHNCLHNYKLHHTTVYITSYTTQLSILQWLHYNITNFLQHICSSANHFLHRPVPFLPDWFHGLLDHLMFLFCSTARFVCMVC